jgi:hypothetical protein
VLLRLTAGKVDADLVHRLDDDRVNRLSGLGARRFGPNVVRCMTLEDAWAICERPAFWVQTNKTYFMTVSLLLAVCQIVFH